MATQTLHYHLTKPASADRVAVGDLNDNADTIDGYLYKANERADQMADDYNASETYNTGDYVRRENYLYKCNTDNTTGTWDSTKWDRVKVMDEITQGGGGGSSTFAGLNDVNVQGVSNGDIARYNSTTQKWTDSSDLTDLELTVSQLQASVLAITDGHTILDSNGTAMAQEDGLQFASGCVEDDAVNGKTVYIEMIRISQANYDTLKANGQLKAGAKYFIYDAQPVAVNASNLPYSSTQSTKDKIDEVASSGNMQIISFPASSTAVEFNSTRTAILSKSGVSLKKGKYAFITSINATWTFGSYQAYLGIKAGNQNSIGFSAANPQSNLPCQVLSEINIPADGTYTIELFGQTAHVSKGVTIPAYQEPKCLMIKL